MMRILINLLLSFPCLLCSLCCERQKSAAQSFWVSARLVVYSRRKSMPGKQWLMSLVRHVVSKQVTDANHLDSSWASATKLRPEKFWGQLRSIISFNRDHFALFAPAELVQVNLSPSTCHVDCTMWTWGIHRCCAISTKVTFIIK